MPVGEHRPRKNKPRGTERVEKIGDSEQRGRWGRAAEQRRVTFFRGELIDSHSLLPSLLLALVFVCLAPLFPLGLFSLPPRTRLDANKSFP